MAASGVAVVYHALRHELDVGPFDGGTFKWIFERSR